MIKDLDLWHEHTFLCECRRVHHMPIKEIVIAQNAISFLKTMPIKYNLARKVLVILDSVIYQLLGESIKDVLESSCCIVDFIILNEIPLLPDEKGLTQVLLKYSDDVAFFVAVGSGAVNDITRYYSFKLNKPYISIPTAASIDGYSANVSLLYINGLKQTFSATHPLAIYADTNVLSKSPAALTASGCGDLAAKLSACTDWEISNIVNNEYYCEFTCGFVLDAVDKCFENVQLIVQRDTQALRVLMEGLMTSGLAMHWVNSSRPAAGAEHHITHFWGMQERGAAQLHGIECAIGTILMGKLYCYLIDYNFNNINIDKEVKKLSDKDKWTDEIKEIYKDKANIIFAQNKDKDFNPDKIRIRIQNIIENEAAIKKILKRRVKKIENINCLMNSFNNPVTPKELGIGKDLLRKSLLYAKEIRNKYTVLDMLSDMGILHLAVADIIKDE